jgi:hypothetical protein
MVDQAVASRVAFGTADMKLYRFTRLPDNDPVLRQKCLEGLRNREVYLSKPKTLNDPFDCQIIIDQTLKAGEFDRLRKWVDADVSNPFRTAILSQTTVSQAFIADLKAKLERLMADVGLACFASDQNQIVMWSHYAASHKGYCLEFEATAGQAIPQGLVFRPVNYALEYPKVLLRDVIIDPWRSLETILFTKSIEWYYEREWRLLSQQGAKNVPYPCKLERVIFGALTANQDMRDIAQAVAPHNLPILKASTSTSEFALDYKPWP